MECYFPVLIIAHLTTFTLCMSMFFFLKTSSVCFDCINDCMVCIRSVYPYLESLHYMNTYAYMCTCIYVFSFDTVYMGVSKNNGTPKWMVKIMEIPMNKWMIWGGFTTPYFWKHPYIYYIYIYTHVDMQILRGHT